MNKWFCAQLMKGACFPKEIPWPSGIDAFIPLAEDVLKRSTPPAASSIQLYYKRQHSDEFFPLVWMRDGGQELGFDFSVWEQALKEERYRPEHQKPWTARIPFHYHRIPAGIRNAVASWLVNRNGQQGKGTWTFPVSLFNGGCEILGRLCDERSRRPLLVLTHDIDTGHGFEWVEPIRTVEEKYGLRSSWHIVPRHYPVQKDILHRLLKSGNEIGLHGIWHNNREAFLSPEQMRQELTRLKDFIAEFSMQGYRSPSWFRTKTMFRVLKDFFAYDLSCPDNDTFCPAGNGGIGFMRPFLFENGLLELPCTLAFESPLFFALRPEQLVSYWRPKIDFVHALGGMLLVNTHPDPHYSGNKMMLRVYDELLAFILEKDWHHLLPRDIQRPSISIHQACSL